MGHLERALEWLRPLILGSNSWDYCVLWKLGDDPSRFIEWVGCCCNGGENQKIGIKRVKRQHNVKIPVCRDVFSMHPAKTKTCDALARMPPSMSLYSGIHGEVVISNRFRWLNIAKTSVSGASDEEFSETQVLIPVVGGLVELFSSKLIPEDQRIIELVKAQFIAYPELETSTSTMSLDGRYINPLLEKNPNNCLPSLTQLEVKPLRQTLTHISHSDSHPYLDGSSTGSFPCDVDTSPESNLCSVSQIIPPKLGNSNHKDRVVETNTLKNRQKPGKERGKSKNLLTERKRRNKITDGLYTLRSSVPFITKMNRAAILGDAIDYILQLQDQIQKLKDELKDAAKEKSCINTAELRISQTDKDFKVQQKIEVQVKGYQIDAGLFLLKIKCQKNSGVLTKMLESLVSLGLHMNDVKDINVTSCDGSIWITLTLQTNKKEIQEEDLREALTRVAV